MQAVIVAAGQGIRLRPRTTRQPKCLLEIAGTSLLERSLDHLREAGFTMVASREPAAASLPPHRLSGGADAADA